MAALSVLCFFRYRRLGDLVKVRVDDITHVGDNIEIFPLAPMGVLAPGSAHA